MFIFQIPDHEQDQTQRDRRNQMGCKELKTAANSRPEAQAQRQEDRRPDPGWYENARYENLVEDTKYSE
jgi:hypothetical protein